jgi:hypothetical protein
MKENWVQRALRWEGNWGVFADLLPVPLLVNGIAYEVGRSIFQSPTMTVMLLVGTFAPALYALAVGLMRCEQAVRRALR